MSDIAFYQLRTTALERALARLLEKVLESGRRALVAVGSEERLEALDAALWTYDQDAFLPHGSARDGAPARQPIFLTSGSENANGAQVLVMLDGRVPDGLEAFERCLDMFDGTDEAALGAARRRWKARKAEGHTLTYWEQMERGRWTRRDLGARASSG